MPTSSGSGGSGSGGINGGRSGTPTGRPAGGADCTAGVGHFVLGQLAGGAVLIGDAGGGRFSACGARAAVPGAGEAAAGGAGAAVPCAGAAVPDAWAAAPGARAAGRRLTGVMVSSSSTNAHEELEVMESMGWSQGTAFVGGGPLGQLALRTTHVGAPWPVRRAADVPLSHHPSLYSPTMQSSAGAAVQ